MAGFSNIHRLPEFERDIKRLLKRFRTLEDDLKVFIDNQLVLLHKLGIDNGGCVPLQGAPDFFKARKFASRALKGTGAKSGIRVIYRYDVPQDRITLVEIYFKADQANENRERIRAFLKGGEKHGEKSTGW